MKNSLDDSQTNATESLFELLDADALLVRTAFDQTQHLFEKNKYINKYQQRKKRTSTSFYCLAGFLQCI